jgi:hypothetical protein
MMTTKAQASFYLPNYSYSISGNLNIYFPACLHIPAHSHQAQRDINNAQYLK